MFCFFKNDALVNFWSNQIGDVFCDLTIRGMKWNQGEIDLVYYPELQDVPELYEFGPSKELTTKKKHIEQHEQVTTDAEGNQTVSMIDIEVITPVKTIQPEVYFAKGVMIRPC